MKNFLLKYKVYIIISVIVFVIIVPIYLFSRKSEVKNIPNPPEKLVTPTPLFITPPPYTQPPLNSQGDVNFSSVSVKTAVENKEKLANDLPIYIKSYRTSNGAYTTLNVFTIPEDPPYLLHIEIYGISYENQSTVNNPNTTAFVDSFNEIKKQLLQREVDIHNIYFIFGQRTYIQNTADYWIKSFGLL